MILRGHLSAAPPVSGGAVFLCRIIRTGVERGLRSGAVYIIVLCVWKNSDVVGRMICWGVGRRKKRKQKIVNFLPDGHKKMASDPHRTATTIVPLLRSHPGGLDRSWSCGTCRDKCTNIFHHSSNIFCFLSQFAPFFLRQSRTFGKGKTRRKSL